VQVRIKKLLLTQVFGHLVDSQSHPVNLVKVGEDEEMVESHYITMEAKDADGNTIGGEEDDDDDDEDEEDVENKYLKPLDVS